MTKQFKYILKDEHKDSGQEPQWLSYSGEPLEKFQDRIKKEGAKLDMYELNNSDVELDEEGLILIGKMMKLFDQIKPHIKIKDIKYIVDDKLAQIGGAAGSPPPEPPASDNSVSD